MSAKSAGVTLRERALLTFTSGFGAAVLATAGILWLGLSPRNAVINFSGAAWMALLLLRRIAR